MNTDHLTLPKPGRIRREPSGAARRLGYLLAAGINLAFLYAVNNVLEWDVLPFLTGEFEQVIPIVNASLAAAIVSNLAYLFFERQWFKSLTQLGMAGISMAATVRIYRVFPFDFSAYEFPWTTLAEVVLIIAMVGIAISIVVETVRLIRAAVGQAN